MSKAYTPILVSVRMSDYGYWVVTWSPAPALRMSTMVCKVGISEAEAITLAGVALVAGKSERTGT